MEVTMEQLIKKHPEMTPVLKAHPDATSYKYYDDNDNLVEEWERRADGHWYDVTERERLKRQIADAAEELAKLGKEVTL